MEEKLSEMIARRMWGTISNIPWNRANYREVIKFRKIIAKILVDMNIYEGQSLEQWKKSFAKMELIDFSS